VNENELVAKMKVFSALEYYRQNKLSLGKAAELADVSTARFTEILGEHDIPSIRYSPAQLDTERSRRPGPVDVQQHPDQ